MSKYIEAEYLGPEKELWKGRSTSPSIRPQYWYQKMEFLDLDKEESIGTDFTLIGYDCDEGVKRNLGRIGAADGSKIIKSNLAKLAIHTPKTIADVGSVKCLSGNMEACQKLMAHQVSMIIDDGSIPIALGGGHDIAFATYQGIIKSKVKNAKLGVINFDAHFDLRPVDPTPNSGTPFNQMMSHCADVCYMVLGIQKESNTSQLFEIARDYKVTYAFNTQCQTENFKQICLLIDEVISQTEIVYISIDLDGFSDCFAPGVSAPSPLGMTPYFVYKCLQYIFESTKVICVDIAEYNPRYDIDSRTAKLAARLINHIVSL